MKRAKRLGQGEGITRLIGAPCVAGDALGELMDLDRGHGLTAASSPLPSSPLGILLRRKREGVRIRRRIRGVGDGVA